MTPIAQRRPPAARPPPRSALAQFKPTQPSVGVEHGKPRMTPGMEAHVGNRSRRLFEMTMAMAVLCLGIQLTLFPQEVFKEGGALSILAMLALPQVWTLAMTILGSVRLIVVIINGVWPLSPIVRQGLSIASLGMWAMLAAGYWSMLPTTKGFPALVLTLIGFVVEANCLYALSVLRVSRQRAQ